jgi:hypothetical protein
MVECKIFLGGTFENFLQEASFSQVVFNEENVEAGTSRHGAGPGEE